MERQDLIDIIAEGIQDATDIDTGPQQWAAGVIRALEAAGYKIMDPEITEDMSDAMFAACDEYDRMRAAKEFPRPTLTSFLFTAAFDAAPTYGEDK